MRDDTPFLIFLFDPFISRLHGKIKGDRITAEERIVKRWDRGFRRLDRSDRFRCWWGLDLRLGSFRFWLALGLCSGLYALIFFFDWLGFWRDSLGRERSGGRVCL